MVEVTGTVGEDTRYAVTVDDGRVTGTPPVVAALTRSVGDQVPLTATGPWIPMALDDPATVVLWLYQNTRVDEVTGSVPPSPRAPKVEAVPGRVY